MRVNTWRRTVLVMAAFMLVAPACLTAQGIDMRVQPAVVLPIAGSGSLFGIGGGADLRVSWRVPPLPLLSVTGEVGYIGIPSFAGTWLSAVPVAAGIGLNWEITPFLDLVAGARGGGYFAMHRQASDFNLLVGGGLGARVSLGRFIRLGIGADFVGLLAFPEPLYTGVSIGLSGSLDTEVFAGRPRLEFQIDDLRPVFPVLYKWYDQNSFGSVTISNNGGSAATNVEVTFLAPEFMDSPKRLVTLEVLEPGDAVEVPLHALFSDRILTVNSPTAVAGIFAAAFDSGDETMTEEVSESVAILNRNAVTWDNDLRATSYVTPTDPAVLRLAKEMSAGVRSSAGGIEDLAFRHAIAAYHAIRAFGVDYVIDPDSAYADISGQTDQLDYLQFPRETLLFGSGDCDDQTVLFCAVLEAVGIPTALVTVPGHILPAVQLSLTPDQILRTFASAADQFIVEDDVVYLPVEMTDASASFLSAWATGYRQYADAGNAAAVTTVAEGWERYGKIGLRDAEPDLDYPQWSQIHPLYSEQVTLIIRAEMEPQVAVLRRQIEDRGSSPRLLNRIGSLYARFGFLDEAEAIFQEILQESEYQAAIVNLGNIEMVRGEFVAAVDLFDRALTLEPDDSLALAGWARALYFSGAVAEAREAIQTLRALDRALADRLAFIGAGDSADSSRASGVQQETMPLDWSD